MKNQLVAAVRNWERETNATFTLSPKERVAIVDVVLDELIAGLSAKQMFGPIASKMLKDVRAGK
jgi:hypothetical protein